MFKWEVTVWDTDGEHVHECAAFDWAYASYYPTGELVRFGMEVRENNVECAVHFEVDGDGESVGEVVRYVARSIHARLI